MTEAYNSDWLLIDQAMIDQFAEVTGDRQYIHIDPVRAATTPYGGTIAHGYLLLSLIPQLKNSMADMRPAGTRLSVNYGGNKVRFLAPVRSGKRIRARARIAEQIEKRAGQILQTAEFTLEIEGEQGPALIAEWLTLFHV
jgi:acyl dehydratase